MITVTYKDATGHWKEDGSEHLLLDQAKAHAIAKGYPEYKAHRDGMQLAHLFNADASPVEHFHKVKAETPTLVEETDYEELDEEDEELDE